MKFVPFMVALSLLQGCHHNNLSSDPGAFVIAPIPPANVCENDVDPVTKTPGFIYYGPDGMIGWSSRSCDRAYENWRRNFNRLKGNNLI